jgi:glycosyltransferase involved in cell wall biosynthesis
MQISVIIPVYNAAEFVEQAVKSALDQPEVAEVLLIEDRSPDNSLAVCQTLAEKYPQVQLYQHPNGENRGAGASRNLGILRSTSPYIAFLDADDYYLPGRFAAARQCFEQNPTADGVYDAVGTYFQDETVRQQWETAKPGAGTSELITITAPVPPERLFEALMYRKSGYFHGNGLVVKRSVFDKTGLFDEHLRLHQDTAMWMKITGKARLVAGQINTPVAMRRAHKANRYAPGWPPRAEKARSRIVMWNTMWDWSRKNLPWSRQKLVLIRLARQVIEVYSDDQPLQRNLRSAMRLVGFVLEHPQAIILKDYWWLLFIHLRIRRLIMDKFFRKSKQSSKQGQ